MTSNFGIFPSIFSTRFEYIFDSFWMSIFSHMHKTELELNTISYEMWYPDIESPTFYQKFNRGLADLSFYCDFLVFVETKTRDFLITEMIEVPKITKSLGFSNDLIIKYLVCLKIAQKAFCFSSIYLLNYVHFGWKPRKATLDGSTFYVLNAKYDGLFQKNNIKNKMCIFIKTI